MVAKIAKKSEITSAAIYRCTVKHEFSEKGVTFKKGDVIYRVNSDSENRSYIVYWDAFLRMHQCTCPATVECKHIRAAREVAIARREFHKQPVSTPAVPLASYDVVSESLKVVNQAIIDARIGTFYEDVVEGALISEVCGHRVKFDVHSHCGCQA